MRRASVEEMPYPVKYVRNVSLRDGTEVLIRPIRPEDAELEREFILGLSDETSFYRFFAVPHEPSPEMIRELCNIDYDKQMALVAETRHGQRKLFAGVGRIMESTENRAEMAIVVGDYFQGKGLANQLVAMLLDFARERKFASVYALILPENTPMINLSRKLGFHIAHQEDRLVIAELPLAS
jgi:acetyltransferase